MARDAKNDSTDSGSTPAATSRSRQRGKPVEIQPKKPWGLIAGSTVLGLALVGVLGYAVANSGSGFEDPVARADESVEGISFADEETLTRNHVAGPVEYPQTPPNGGDHSGQWQNCNGDIYDQPINNENAVHSLEHGAVWVTYKPDLPAAEIAELRELVQGEPFTLMSPLPEQSAPINLSAWGRRLTVESASDERAETFLETFAGGPQTPEKGATCGGGVTTTRAAAPADAPAAPSGASGAPSAAATVPSGCAPRTAEGAGPCGPAPSVVPRAATPPAGRPAGAPSR